MNKKIILSALAALPMFAMSSAADSYGTISYEYVNIRSNPSMKDSVNFVLRKGDTVQILAKKGGWLKIKKDNKYGWVQSNAINPINPDYIKKSSKNLQTYVSTKTALLRFSPSSSSKALKELKKGDSVKILESGASWSKVKVGNYEGYISSNSLSSGEDASMYRVVTSDTLNLREKDNVSSKRLVTLKKGSIVEYISETDGWTKVRYNNVTGYVSSLYLKNTNKKSQKQDDITLQNTASFDISDIKHADKLSSGGGVKYINTATSLDSFANDEMTKSLNMIHDGKFRKATIDEIKKYMDPNTFTNQASKMQFARLDRYTEDITPQQLNRFFAENCNANSIFQNQGQAFINAARNNDINVLYLVAHSMVETGGGTSALSSGVVVNGEKVYNFFGIGAVDGNALQKGAETAYKNGWNTVEKGINGAANWIAKKYIHNTKYNQNTLYSMKWSKEFMWHQYASDIRWAYHIGLGMAKVGSYSDRVNDLSYEIPTYN